MLLPVDGGWIAKPFMNLNRNHGFILLLNGLVFGQFTTSYRLKVSRLEECPVGSNLLAFCRHYWVRAAADPSSFPQFARKFVMYVNGDIPENVHYHRIDSEVFIQQISVFAFHRLHLTDAFSASIRMESNIHSDGKRESKNGDRFEWFVLERPQMRLLTLWEDSPHVSSSCLHTTQQRLNDFQVEIAYFRFFGIRRISLNFREGKLMTDVEFYLIEW